MTTATPRAVAPRTVLRQLLAPALGDESALRALALLTVDPALLADADETGNVTRAQLAMALNVALFCDLLGRVPTAARYVTQEKAAGESIVFDHGALRTIDGPTGALPRGHEAFGRFLRPLGYQIAGLYPLPALTMTGRAYAHRDFPDVIPQFFVSELHIDQLPLPAQRAAAAVFSSSRDPLGETEKAAVAALDATGTCSLADGIVILHGALAAFGRQHPAPALGDYETLLAHSKEGAWIATEGNAFNHATTRVPDVEVLSERLRSEGYPIKPSVEISRNGRVRQTAFLADKVDRSFRLPDGREVQQAVPGSFYEFISRDVDPATGRLDLTFDSGNATGIFAVTRTS